MGPGPEAGGWAGRQESPWKSAPMAEFSIVLPHWPQSLHPHHILGAATYLSLFSCARSSISSLHLLSYSCPCRPPRSVPGSLAVTFEALNQVLLPRIVPPPPWAAISPAIPSPPAAVYPGKLLQALALTPIHLEAPFPGRTTCPFAPDLLTSAKPETHCGQGTCPVPCPVPALSPPVHHQALLS